MWVGYNRVSWVRLTHAKLNKFVSLTLPRKDPKKEERKIKRLHSSVHFMQYVNFAIYKIISNIYIILYTSVNIVGYECLLKIGTTSKSHHNLRLLSRCACRSFSETKLQMWVGVVVARYGDVVT